MAQDANEGSAHRSAESISLLGWLPGNRGPKTEEPAEHCATPQKPLNQKTMTTPNTNGQQLATFEITALRDAMSALLGPIHGALARCDREVHSMLLKCYHAMRGRVVTAQGGPHKSLCSDCDPGLWSLFSDTHKDRHGVRPHGAFTLAEVETRLAEWHRETEEAACR